jgi:hypothetical protein
VILGSRFSVVCMVSVVTPRRANQKERNTTDELVLSILKQEGGPYRRCAKPSSLLNNLGFRVFRSTVLSYG